MLYLTAHVPEYIVHLLGHHHLRGDLPPVLGQFVQQGDVHITVVGDSQGTRDGGGGHSQYVWIDPFFHEPAPLYHPEAVLFIHDDKGQVSESNAFLEEGMGPNHQQQAARCQVIENGGPFGFWGAAGKQGQGQVHLGGQVLKGPEVLLGQDFRRGHDGHLSAIWRISGHNGRGQQGHHRLATAHVALQEAVHHPPGLEVGPHLTHHPHLGLGKLKWKTAVDLSHDGPQLRELAPGEGRQ